MSTVTKLETKQVVTIRPANIQMLEVAIEGTAPLVMHRFSKKADLMEAMQQGSTSKKGKKHPPRDFEKDMHDATHVSEEGWQGIPASAFRSAMISACRLCGFKMTHAKLSLFVQADGFDAMEGQPLVRFEGVPEMNSMHCRVANGKTDIRIRPMWRHWSANLRVEFDADQFTMDDVINLLDRVGRQVGGGEGRPDSRNGGGMGWGTFKIAG